MGSYLATPEVPPPNTITLVYYDHKSDIPITRYKTFTATEFYVAARNLILTSPMNLLEKVFDLNREDVKTIVSITSTDEAVQSVPDTNVEMDPDCSYLSKLSCS
jgi:hypothetical protein